MSAKGTAISSVIYLFLFLFGFLVLSPETYCLGLICSIFFFTFLVLRIVKAFGFNSLAFFFLLFLGLYAYSVPISIVFNFALSPHLYSYLSSWGEVDRSLIAYTVCVHLALTGCWLSSFFIGKATQSVYQRVPPNANYKPAYIILGALSSLFEGINILRVGGWSTVMLGKKAFQSAIAETSLMLPSERFFYLSVIFFAINHLKKKIGLNDLLLLCSVNIIYIYTNLIIGERGTFVALIGVLFISIFYFKPITRISIKYILLASIVYYLFSIMTIYRDIYLDYDKPDLNSSLTFIRDNKSRLQLLLNPANSEFGAPCLNFRVLYQSEAINSSMKYKYGATYFHVFRRIPPQKLNPIFDESVTIKFRNKYFSERAEGGSSGGTAFSSIMEAYVNFSFIGPFIVYFIVFLLIIIGEKRRLANFNLFSFLVYTQSFEVMMLFQRSSFEYTLGIFIFYYIVSFIISKSSCLK